MGVAGGGAGSVVGPFAEVAALEEDGVEVGVHFRYGPGPADFLRGAVTGGGEEGDDGGFCGGEGGGDSPAVVRPSASRTRTSVILPNSKVVVMRSMAARQ